jgi:hypothetical protein
MEDDDDFDVDEDEEEDEYTMLKLMQEGMMG